MPETNTDTSSNIQGPDQKWYKVKSKDMKAFDQKFITQGWIKKDGKWFTQTGEPARMSTPNALPSNIGGGASTGGHSVALQDPKTIKQKSAVGEYMGESLPTVGASAGSMAMAPFGKGAQVAGAAGGGMAGEAFRQLYRGIILNEDQGPKKDATNIAWEGVKQAALEKGGQKAGELFFSALNKIPHAKIINGLKFLPSEYMANGKISKYVEDLLSNLAPSAKTMEEFKTLRDKTISKLTDTLANGFGRFSGTSEEMGILVKKTLTEGRAQLQKGLDATYNAYIKKGNTPKQATNYLKNTSLYKEMVQKYENELVRNIIKTNKPELIAGLLRSTGAALEETRILNKTLTELKPDVLGKVQNRIMRDVVNEALTGSKDPTAKGIQQLTQKFAGNRFKTIIDDMGEERLTAIYGQQGYKNIEDFIKLTGTIGGDKTGSGVGRFMNLMFLVPFRGGVSANAVMKLTGTAFIANRAAKFITSTEGIRLYESYIKAMGANSPRLINLAVEEINKFNQRTDEEFAREQQEAERQYQDIKQKEKK